MDRTLVIFSVLFLYDLELVSLSDAAARANLDPDEVAWALEEFGECATERYVIVGWAASDVPVTDAQVGQ